MGERQMLHIGNIKIALNNGPDLSALQPAATNNHQDPLSSAGFFSILKNQMHADGQIATPLADKQDAHKNDTPAAANETINPLSMSAAQEQAREDQKLAEGKAVEQSQKAAQQNQAKETRNADAPKNPGENRPDIEQKLKNVTGKENETGQTKRSSKLKKSDEPDMRDMIEGLQRMIDMFKGKEHTEIRNVKLAAQELIERHREARMNGDRTPLKKALEKLSAALKKLDSHAAQASPAEHLAGALAGMKSRQSKMKTSQDNNHSRKTASSPDAQIAAVKDLLGRIEAALEAVRGDGPRQNTGGENRGSGDIFSFGHMKGETIAKHADGPAVNHKNSLFRESLENMIQNARVAVKDGQNASFSIRLHPREMGSVNISLNLQDGIVMGKFMVDTQEAKDLLTHSLDYIKQQLNESGVQVGEFQVNVNDRQSSLLDDRGGEKAVFITPAEQVAEIEQEYAVNAKSFHDGHFNVVI
jgi:flagellar hook-length control protein FliK